FMAGGWYNPAVRPKGQEVGCPMHDREEAAKFLAKRHYLFEPGITAIYPICSGAPSDLRADEPIRLLEVNENTIPSGIMPLRFDGVPSSGIQFPSVIVEVTPDEYEQIRKDQLKLPTGWILGPVLPRPNQEGDDR